MINLLLATTESTVNNSQGLSNAEMFGTSWYIYFAFLGGIIVLCSLILAMWRKQSHAKLAYKYVKKGAKRLQKAKEHKNPKVNLIVAQNYFKSAYYFISQDDRRDDISLAFDRREKINDILELSKELNHHSKTTQQDVVNKIDRLLGYVDDLEKIQ